MNVYFRPTLLVSDVNQSTNVALIYFYCVSFIAYLFNKFITILKIDDISFYIAKA